MENRIKDFLNAEIVVVYRGEARRVTPINIEPCKNGNTVVRCEVAGGYRCLTLSDITEVRV